MELHRDQLGLPIGAPVDNWTPPPRPPRSNMEGRYCRVEPLDLERHAADLFAANALDKEGRNWAYMGYGPFADLAGYLAWIEADCLGDDPMFHAIVDLQSGRAVGVASYLRIDPNNGSIEVGHINFAPPLQRTRAATEAMYLMMQRAFDLGYRRYEWKCNALNAASCRAAMRLGFSYEGVFRQATISKGRNRDTAWYAAIDSEWPAIRAAFQAWLSLENFAADVAQLSSLTDLTAPILVSRG